jgi:hypothetical protein
MRWIELVTKLRAEPRAAHVFVVSPHNQADLHPVGTVRSVIERLGILEETPLERVQIVTDERRGEYRWIRSVLSWRTGVTEIPCNSVYLTVE